MQFKIFILTFILIPSFAFGQGREKDLGSEQVEILGEFNPVIQDAAKLGKNPIINDTTSKIPVSPYKLIDKKVSTTFEVDPIPSARMKGEPLTKLYRAYIKGGFGNYTTPMGEIYLNSLRSKEYHVGLAYRHLSSGGTLPDVAHSGFSDNKLSLFGKYFMDEYTVSGDFDFTRNVVHYYGFNPEVFPADKIDIRQRFNMFSPQIQLESNYRDTAKIHHKTGVGFYNFSDVFDTARENNVSLNSQLRRYHGKELLALNTNLGYWHRKSPVDTVFNLILNLNPHVISGGDKWRAKVGMNLAMQTETNEPGSIHFYPDAEFSFNLVENIIIPYAGVTGGLKRNSYHSLADENPFIEAFAPMRNTNTLYDVYGGIRGVLSSELTFNTRFSYSDNKEFALFVNSPSDMRQNRFTVTYDNVKLIDITGELAFQRTEKLKVLLKGDYFNYQLENQEYAWHRPDYEIDLSVFYSLRDKIILKSDVYYVSHRWARDHFGTEDNPVVTGTPYNIIRLNGFVDANLGLEYRYTKHLSAFINFNNIGAVRYNRWYKYPVQRFNVLGGFTFSF